MLVVVVLVGRLQILLLVGQILVEVGVVLTPVLPLTKLEKLEAQALPLFATLAELAAQAAQSHRLAVTHTIPSQAPVHTQHKDK